MRSHIAALDGIRGLSAIYILIHHARLALTQPYKSGLSLYPEKYGVVDKAMVYFFSMFKFGQEGVIIFFVLSGFLIHLKQAKNPDYKDFNLTRYFKNRIIRIYPTLIGAILLCVFLDNLLFLMNKEYFQNVFDKYTLLNFLTNFFLVPETHAWGNNFPIWSLKHEWFFYLAYPLLFYLATLRKIFPLLIVMGLYISYLLGLRINYMGEVATTLLIWVLGAILAEIYVRGKKLNLLFGTCTIILIISYPFIPYDLVYPFKDLVFGMITCGGFYFIISNKFVAVNKLLLKFSNLGVWSYSLYLLHMPLINTYQSLLRYFTKQDSMPFHLWHVLIASIIILPIVYVLFYFTERYAINYKQKAAKNLNILPKSN